jgi:hypothetical protein
MPVELPALVRVAVELNDKASPVRSPLEMLIDAVVVAIFVFGYLVQI